ncbi:MAG: hypothetical protein LPH21_14770, partial [Shewanella sp.]|nr:hypothetical protein [Shewanella sp.]
VVGAPPCHYQLVDSRIELYSCQGRVHKTHGILTEARGKIVVSDLFVYHEVVLDTGLDAAPGTLNVELLVHTIGVATLTGKHGTLIGRGLGRVCRYQLVDSRIQLYMCRNVVPVPDSTLTGARGKIAASINVEMSRVCYHTLLDSRIELYSCAVMEPTNYGFLAEARGRIDAAANTNRLCAFQIPDRRFELPQLFSARRYVPQGRLEVNPIGPLSNRLKTAFVSRLGYGRDTLDQRTHNNALSLFLYFSCNHSSTRFEANNVIAIYNSQDESILTLDLIGIETNATQPDVVRVRSHIMTDPPFVDVLLTPTTLGGRWYKIGVTLVPSSEDTTAIFVHQGGQLKFEVGTFNSFERTSWKTQFAPEENVNIAAAYTWDRVLSDPEYWQLSEQPFGIWLPD